MRKRKKWYGFFLTVFLLAAAALPVQAAETDTDTYTYTVTFLSGDKGVFDLSEINVSVERGGAGINVPIDESAEKIVVSGLNYGDQVSITPDVITDDSMYYVRGIRKAGYDNNDEAAMLAANKVEHDTEYVVAYGVPGEMVNYTVRYVDEAGNTLSPQRTYKGKIGDTPVAGYIYIEGYQPMAYNLTKTLVADEKENIFTFVYTPLPAGTAGGGGGGTTTVVTTTTTTTEGAGEGAAGADAAGAAGAAADAGAAAAQDDAGGAPAALEDEGVPEAGPQELINLDDEETPLAGGFLNEGLQPAGYMAVFIGLACVAVLVAAFMFFWLGRRKKQEVKVKNRDES